MGGRNEDKYLISINDYRKLKNRLSSVLYRDSHSNKNGEYYITSLYFDDKDFNCADDTEAGIGERYKYRIRYYGDDINKIFLEKKSKINGICYKESSSISKCIYDKIVKGECSAFLYSEDHILRSFALFALKKQLHPVCIINYCREAYVDELTNVRITFDSNIRVSKCTDDFFNKNRLSYPVGNPEEKILEVKYNSLIQSHIRNLLALEEITQTSFSKYYLGYEAIKGEIDHEYFKYVY